MAVLTTWTHGGLELVKTLILDAGDRKPNSDCLNHWLT